MSHPEQKLSERAFDGRQHHVLGNPLRIRFPRKLRPYYAWGRLHCPKQRVIELPIPVCQTGLLRNWTWCNRNSHLRRRRNWDGMHHWLRNCVRRRRLELAEVACCWRHRRLGSDCLLSARILETADSAFPVFVVELRCAPARRLRPQNGASVGRVSIHKI